MALTEALTDEMTPLAKRRILVEDAIIDRKPVAQMAEELGVSRQTIYVDIRAIKDRWLEERRARVDEFIAEDLQRLAIAERALMPAVRAGKWLAFDRLLQSMDRRARWLGYDAPTRTRVEIITEDRLVEAIREKRKILEERGINVGAIIDVEEVIEQAELEEATDVA